MIEKDIKIAVVLVVMVTLLAGILSFLTSTSITNPIRHLLLSITQLAEGKADLSQRLPPGSNDELGLVAVSFNQFMDTLKRMVEGIADTVSKINKTTQQSSQMTVVANGYIADQKEKITESKDAVGFMGVCIKSIVDEAQQAKRIAMDISAQTEKSKQVVDQSTVNVKALAEKVLSSVKEMERLRDSSKEVSQVVEAIKGVAEQTNLLALNAAIEAARAGEQGRGFAVVADEVRGLAIKTQDSTVDIQRIIDGIQLGIKTASDSMLESNQFVHNCVEGNQQIHGALANTFALTEEAQRISTCILSSTEQHTATSDVDDKMREVHEMVESSYKIMADLQKGSRTLEETSAQLGEMVKGFKSA